MKNLLIKRGYLLFFSVFFYSCKKDLNDVRSKQDDLKSWYEQNINKSNVNPFNKMEPNWTTLYVNKSIEQTVYEIDLTDYDSIFITTSFIEKKALKNFTKTSRIKFVILQNNKNEKITRGFYMVLDSDKSIHYKETKMFDGTIYYYNTSGSFINGANFINGRINKVLSPAETKDIVTHSILLNIDTYLNYSKGQKKISVDHGQSQDCRTDYLPVYGVKCVGYESDMGCEIYIKTYTPIIMCDKVSNTEDDPGVGTDPGSGGGGIIAEPKFNDIIDSLTSYPCPSELLRELPSLKNDLANLINDTFNGNCRFHITFKAANLGPSLDGEFVPHALEWDEDNMGGFTANATIRISEDVLKHATKEYILVTMYHEALHAYLSIESYRLGPDAFINKYPEINSVLTNGYDITKSLIVDRHGRMARTFVGGLVNAVKSLNPNMNDNSVNAIAAAGILALDPQAAILNQNERDTRLGNYRGKKCR